jgi:ABC-type transport system involved in cytochrome c biogenesis permease component
MRPYGALRLLGIIVLPFAVPVWAGAAETTEATAYSSLAPFVPAGAVRRLQ